MAARLRLRHLWFFVPFWALAIRAGRDILDNSFLWHVQAGTDQLAAGEVLRTDLYSLTAVGEPWRTQSWLIELGYARLEGWFADLAWVPWFVYAVAALTLGLVLSAVWSRTGPTFGAAIVLLTVGWVAQPYVHPRPALLSFALFAVIGLLIAMQRPPLWVVPGLLWLWAALHGSFVLGALFLVLDAIRRRSRMEFAAVGVGMVAGTLTAHGVAVWEILYEFFQNRDGLSLIQEWRPPDFTTPWLAGFLVAVALLMVGFAHGKLAPTSLWIVIPAVVLGMSSARSVLPALLVLAPWLGDASRAIPDPAESHASPFVAWATAFVLIVSAATVLAQPIQVTPELLPSAEARDALAPAPLFNSVGVGGALIYADAGDRPVFIDDRVELYGSEFLRRYAGAAEGREWQELFADYGVRQALLSIDSDLRSRLDDAGWVTCYEDDYFVVAAERCSS